MKDANSLEDRPIFRHRTKVTKNLQATRIRTAVLNPRFFPQGLVLIALTSLRIATYAQLHPPRASHSRNAAVVSDPATGV